MTHPRILIAGVGNIFLGDDAFGVEVVQRLAARPQPEGVRIVDFGIRGLDLTYALLEGYDAAILVDATSRGHAPGTLYVIEPDPAAVAGSTSPGSIAPADLMIDPHGMEPAKVLRLVAAMGGRIGRLLMVGCEPTPLNSPEEMEMGITPPVLAAIEEAVALVESLVLKIRRGEYESIVSSESSDHAPLTPDGDCEHVYPNTPI